MKPIRNVWLISPFSHGSHERWKREYSSRSRHSLSVFQTPNLSWKQCLLESHQSLGASFRQARSQNGDPDAIIATSLFDLGEFRKLHAFGCPHIYYLHENQLVYPLPPGSRRHTHLADVHVRSILVADHVAFNSHHHRDTVLEYAQQTEELAYERLQRHSSVVYCGLSLPRGEKKMKCSPPTVLWNHRWAADKQPGLAMRSLLELKRRRVEFYAIVCGEESDFYHKMMQEIADKLDNSLLHFGYLPPEKYDEMLMNIDVVFSTAIHENFGYSVCEAVASGARAVVPNRCAYPELLSPDVSYLYDADEDIVSTLHAAVLGGAEASASRFRVDINSEVTTESLDSLVDNAVGGRAP